MCRCSEWSGGHSGFLCLSKGMLRVFRLLPLNLLRHFLEKGKQAMKEAAPDGLRAVLMPRDTAGDGGGGVPRSPRSPRSPIRTSRPTSRTSPLAENAPVPAPPMSPRPGSPMRRSTPKPESPRAAVASSRPAGAASPRPAIASSPRRAGSAASFRAVNSSGGEHDAHVQLMTQLLAYQLRQAGGTRGQLMVLSKLTLLCPPLLARALPVLRFHLARHTWLPHVPHYALAQALRKHRSTTRAIHSLSTDLMEVSLWIKMAALPVQQVSMGLGHCFFIKLIAIGNGFVTSPWRYLSITERTGRAPAYILIIFDYVYCNTDHNINTHQNYFQVMAVQEQGLTLLHLACLFGDARLAKACLTVVISPLPPNSQSWSGLTAMEVAAAQGNTRLMEVLLKAGAHAPKSILVAASVGKAYTGTLCGGTAHLN